LTLVLTKRVLTRPIAFSGQRGRGLPIEGSWLVTKIHAIARQGESTVYNISSSTLLKNRIRLWPAPQGCSV